MPEAEETVLSDLSAELLFTQPFQSGDSIIQAVCATDDYIITLENCSKTQITADVVTAYYKNDTDPAGNPVEKYSIANQVYDQDWEHGNCMTYNPNTGYIYVALYTAFNPELRGCIYVMDPATLGIIGTQKISDDFNLLSIAYSPEENIYYGQTDKDGNYSIFTMDTDFNVIENFGPSDPTPGYNFQGFCKSGEYLVQSPLTIGLGIGDYMLAYHIPERAFVDCQSFNFGRDDATKVEPEQIAPLGDGSFVVAVNSSYNDEYGFADIYRVVYPHLSEVNDGTSPEVQPAAEAEEAPPVVDEEVTITTEMEQMTSVETTSADEEVNEIPKEPSKPFNPAPVIIIIVIAAVGFIAVRMYMVNLERKRRIRNARLKRARKLLKESIQREIDESQW